MGWLRRNYDERRKDFDTRNHCAEAEFLTDLGLKANTREAVLALAIRSVIAELAEVRPEAICANHSFANDLSPLGMWDSLDTVEFVLRLEARIGNAIPDEQAEKLPGLADRDRVDPGYTVGTMVRQMISFLSRGGN